MLVSHHSVVESICDRSEHFSSAEPSEWSEWRQTVILINLRIKFYLLCLICAKFLAFFSISVLSFNYRSSSFVFSFCFSLRFSGQIEFFVNLFIKIFEVNESLEMHLLRLDS